MSSPLMKKKVSTVIGADMIQSEGNENIHCNKKNTVSKICKHNLFIYIQRHNLSNLLSTNSFKQLYYLRSRRGSPSLLLWTSFQHS